MQLSIKRLEKLRHDFVTSFCHLCVCKHWKTSLENMGRKSVELSTEVKEMIVNSANHTPNKAELARMFGIPRSTIVSILNKFDRLGTVENLPRSGRQLLFTIRDKTKLSRLAKANRRDTLTDLTNKLNEGRGRQFSEKTVFRKLREEGYKRKRARKTMVVRCVNRKKRVKWCQERKNWKSDNEWKKYIFSDESQIVIGTDNRVYVWRKDAEANSPHLICPPSKRKVTLMIWGCMCFDGMGTIVPVEGNINALKYLEIVDNNLWPVIARHFPNKDYVFQDDNAPVHRAHVVKNYMTENNINCTDWPAQSPDLNVIENIWLKIKRELKGMSATIESRDQLFHAIRQVWENIPLEYVHSLYASIPDRIKEVIRMKGNLTKY